MAEEYIDSQVISQKTESEECVERVDLTGRLIITKDGNKIFSRYLSGPIGSCHDICKYGVKQAADEPKPSSAKLKKVVTRGRKTKLPKETVIFVVKNKSTDSPKPSPTPTSRLATPNSPVVIKQVAPTFTNEENFSSEKNFPTFEETDVPMEHTRTDLNQNQLEQSTLKVKECPNGHTNKEKVRSKTPIRSSSRKKGESISQQIRAYPIAGKQKSVSPTHSLSSKNYVKKSSRGSAKIAKNLKGVTYLNNQKNAKYVNPEPTSMPEKILHAIDSTSENEPVGSTLAYDATELSSTPPSISMDKSLKETNKPIRKSGRPASSRKRFRNGGNRIHLTKSLASFSQFSGSKSTTYKQHKVRSASSSLSSCSSSPSPSRLPAPPSNCSLGKQIGATNGIGKQNRATSKHTKIGRNYQGGSAKLAYKIRPTRITIAGVGNKVTQAQKLCFSRGNVIELRPQSNNLPRRLKFKPVRLLNDIQKDTNATKKRTIGMKEVDDGKSKDAKDKSEKVLAKPQNQIMERKRSFRRKAVDGSKLDGLKAGSEKVVLRHQNMEGKRVTRRLYNNVIEETASKLAEQRQSKVKALVGAFETVITLDSHSTSPNATSTNG